MKKQCIVFIDDFNAVNKLQIDHLKRFVANNAPEFPAPFENDGKIKYMLNDDFREVTVLSMVASLKRDGENNARNINLQKIENVREYLEQLKKEFDTVLPIVDLCLSGSKGMDPAWGMDDVKSFFASLFSFKIMLLVSGIVNAIELPDRKYLEDQNTLFVPRPIIQVDPYHPYFDEDSNSMSTCEASFFANIMLGNDFVKLRADRELFRKLTRTEKGYNRYFYTILVANDILFYL